MTHLRMKIKSLVMKKDQLLEELDKRRKELSHKLSRKVLGEIDLRYKVKNQLGNKKALKVHLLMNKRKVKKNLVMKKEMMLRILMMNNKG
jgi:hypothetical protein